jgi:hypothetical protein
VIAAGRFWVPRFSGAAFHADDEEDSPDDDPSGDVDAMRDAYAAAKDRRELIRCDPSRRCQFRRRRAKGFGRRCERVFSAAATAGRGASGDGTRQCQC